MKAHRKNKGKRKRVTQQMSDDKQGGRTTVIDVPRSFSPVKRKRSKSNAPESSQRTPIELTPVMQAVKEYARRTHSIGALQGAYALQRLASKIRGITPRSDVLSAIADNADAEASILKEYVKKIYED